MFGLCGKPDAFDARQANGAAKIHLPRKTGMELGRMFLYWLYNLCAIGFQVSRAQ